MRLITLWLAGLMLGSAAIAFSAAATPQKDPAVHENFYGVTIIDNQAWIVGY